MGRCPARTTPPSSPPTAIARLSQPFPTRLTDVTRTFLDGAIEATDGEVARLLRAVRDDDVRASDEALPGVCLPIYARALDAMLRDTLSTNVVRAGVKFNVIPGEAILELDCRRLPGTTEPEMEASIRARLGPELAAVTDIELVIESDGVVADYEAADGLYPVLAAVIREHDPDGVPLPAMAPYSTDAKHLARARRARPSASRPFASHPTRRTSNAGTASTSASRSRASDGACRSSTMRFGGSADDVLHASATPRLSWPARS